MWKWCCTYCLILAASKIPHAKTSSTSIKWWNPFQLSWYFSLRLLVLFWWCSSATTSALESVGETCCPSLSSDRIFWTKNAWKNGGTIFWTKNPLKRVAITFWTKTPHIRWVGILMLLRWFSLRCRRLGQQRWPTSSEIAPLSTIGNLSRTLASDTWGQEKAR